MNSLDKFLARSLGISITRTDEVLSSNLILRFIRVSSFLLLPFGSFVELLVKRILHTPPMVINQVPSI